MKNEQMKLRPLSLMTDYTVKYVDKEGDLQDFQTVGKTITQAISAVKELCPDCRRIISCTPTPMFNEWN